MWLKVKTTAIDCKAPSTRDGHCCSNIGKDMYMHGGKGSYVIMHLYVGTCACTCRYVLFECYSYVTKEHVWHACTCTCTLYI